MLKSVLAPPPSLPALQESVRRALLEDLSYGDITTNILIDPTLHVQATIFAKQPMVVAGILVAQEVFRQVDSSLRLTMPMADGQWVSRPTAVLKISGSARSLLQAERVALNFLQHLSGISTLTHHCCEAIKGSSTKIVDTRKTTPGLRALEKWAVRLGGGYNHRYSLHDGILIKDNHLSILATRHIGLTEACLRAKQQAPHGLKISVEVENMRQVQQALQGQADIILLDNMSPAQVHKAIDLIKGRALTEVSGGITCDTLQRMAEANPDFISMGALTHSAPCMDLSMEIFSSTTRRPSSRRRVAHT